MTQISADDVHGKEMDWATAWCLHAAYLAENIGRDCGVMAVLLVGLAFACLAQDGVALGSFLLAASVWVLDKNVGVSQVIAFIHVLKKKPGSAHASRRLSRWGQWLRSSVLVLVAIGFVLLARGW